MYITKIFFLLHVNNLKGGIVSDDGPIVDVVVGFSFVFIFLWSIWAKTLEINFIIQTITRPSAGKRRIIWRSIPANFTYLFILFYFFPFVFVYFSFSFWFHSTENWMYKLQTDALAVAASSRSCEKRKWKSCKIVCHFDEIFFWGRSNIDHKSIENLLGKSQMFHHFAVCARVCVRYRSILLTISPVPRATTNLGINANWKQTQHENCNVLSGKRFY